MWRYGARGDWVLSPDQFVAAPGKILCQGYTGDLFRFFSVGWGLSVTSNNHPGPTGDAKYSHWNFCDYWKAPQNQPPYTKIAMLSDSTGDWCELCAACLLFILGCGFPSDLWWTCRIWKAILGKRNRMSLPSSACEASVKWQKTKVEKRGKKKYHLVLQQKNRDSLGQESLCHCVSLGRKASQNSRKCLGKGREKPPLCWAHLTKWLLLKPSVRRLGRRRSRSRHSPGNSGCNRGSGITKQLWEARF